MSGDGEIPPCPDRVDREADACAPVQPTFVVPHGFDHHVALDAGHPEELFDDARSLQCSLRAELDVLEVTAATATGTGERARWRHTVG